MEKIREIKFRVWDEEKMSPPFTIVEFGNTEGTVAKDAVFLQYTGLKDKNGKEIYEGDILKYENGLTHTVEWKGFDIPYRNETGSHQAPERINCLGYIHYTSFSRSEIIGNIYENADLIK